MALIPTGGSLVHGFLASRFLTLAAGFTVAALAALPLVAAEAAPPQSAGRSAEHARIVEHWTPARRAAATPRDFVLDEAGNAFLKLPHGGLEFYGRPTGGAAQPMAKPGGGGGGTGDTGPTSIGNLDPSGSTIGASHTFKATVADPDGVRSVTFSVRKGTARAQNFSASLSDAATNVWTMTLSGFSDGTDWSWQVIAKDRAGITTSSAWTAFAVSVSGGGGGGGGEGSVTNAPWTVSGDLQTAAGRIYFEMPSNARRTRWAGYVCSGTVVTDGTSGRSVILTAAHCVYDDANKAFARNVLFIPNQDATTGTGTDRNCDNDPLGCWTPNFGVVDQNWTTRTFPDNKAWDYAFYVVSDSGRQSGSPANSALDEAAKSVGISFNAPVLGKFTYALGYSYSDDPNYMYCAANMTTEGADNWWVPGCGLSGGSSGGSWFQDEMLPTNGTGSAMSVNSWGYTTSPGMAGPRLNGTSASRLFCRAQKEGFASVPTTDGNAGITVSAGTATCP